MRDLVKNREQTIFTGKVDRISNSGNGVIEIEKGHIIVGPLPTEAVGEEIKGVLTNSPFSGAPTAYCVNEKHITNEYLKWVIKKFEPVLREEYEYNGAITTKIKRISNSGNALAYNPAGFQEFLIVSPPEELVPGDVVEVKPENNQKKQHRGENRANFVGYVDESEDNKSMYEKTVDEWAKKAKDVLNLDEMRESKPDVIIYSEGDYERVTKSNESTKQPSTEEPNSADSSDQSPTEDIDLLRKQAEKNSVDNVTESASKTQSTKQYHRSQAVRDYVMARADGVCEGCETSAPFTSKTGDPYLHAHHVYELSDGGSDTPDTVIALCPNCHYRVHHGEDGNEYNKELEQKLSEIE